MRTILQNIQYEGKIKAGYITGFFLLLVSFLLTLYANSELIKNAKLVAHTHKVIANLELMLSKVKDGEIGFRGYLITGDVDYLTPYFGSRKSVDSIFNETKLLVADNKVQVQNIDSVKFNIEKKYAYFEKTLKSVRHSNQVNTPGMLDSFKTSKANMDFIRKGVFQMQNREHALIGQRDQKLKIITDAVQSIVIASIIIAFFLVVFGFSTHVKENKHRMRAEKKVRTYQDELKARIEELAEANNELIQMRRQEKFAATGRIARTIAHEIRNPLTNINLAADQLSAEFPPNDENTGFLFEMITRNSHRINQLISELLNSTKFAELNFLKVSVNELLDETLKQAEDRMMLNNVQLVKIYANDICEISVDKDKIKIAFLNIVINALEAMEAKENAQLLIETKKEGDKCVVMITDTGSGIDEESEAKLFEPYFTTKKKGNGLGLTNTQNIILNHKGNINVKTKAGEGTCFTITLNID